MAIFPKQGGRGLATAAEAGVDFELMAMDEARGGVKTVAIARIVAGPIAARWDFDCAAECVVRFDFHEITIVDGLESSVDVRKCCARAHCGGRTKTNRRDCGCYSLLEGAGHQPCPHLSLPGRREIAPAVDARRERAGPLTGVCAGWKDDCLQARAFRHAHRILERRTAWRRAQQTRRTARVVRQGK